MIKSSRQQSFFEDQAYSDYNELCYLIKLNMLYRARKIASDLAIEATTQLRRNGDTIIHICAEYGQVKLFIYFQQLFQSELDIKNNLDETPFTVAAREGRLNIIQMFYDYYPGKFNADNRTQDGWTAFTYASINCFLNTIQYLAEKRVNIHTSDRIKRNALHWACRFNNDRVVQLLLKLGLNLDAYDYEKKKPLDLCKIHFSEEAEKVIICFQDAQRQSTNGKKKPTKKKVTD